LTLNDIVRGLAQAVRLILSADPALMEIILLTLRVSGLALALSTLVGVPVGAALDWRACERAG